LLCYLLLLGNILFLLLLIILHLLLLLFLLSLLLVLRQGPQAVCQQCAQVGSQWLALLGC